MQIQITKLDGSDRNVVPTEFGETDDGFTAQAIQESLFDGGRNVVLGFNLGATEPTDRTLVMFASNGVLVAKSIAGDPVNP